MLTQRAIVLSPYSLHLNVGEVSPPITPWYTAIAVQAFVTYTSVFIKDVNDPDSTPEMETVYQDVILEVAEPTTSGEILKAIMSAVIANQPKGFALADTDILVFPCFSLVETDALLTPLKPVV